jgi:chorismate mutase
MRKNKHIFLLGALFFLFALVKYAFISHELPTTFIVFEILSFLVILFIIYYVLNLIEICVNSSGEVKLEKDCIRHQAEINRLRSKLLTLEEERQCIDEIDEHDNKRFVENLQKFIHSYDSTAVKQIVDSITERYEVMAAIGYCTDDEGRYNPVKLYGIDEEISIPAIEIEDGLHSQAIHDNKAIQINDIPADYVEVGSGSGSGKPLVLYLLPMVDGNKGIIIEVAAFKKLDLIEIWNQLSIAK